MAISARATKPPGGGRPDLDSYERDGVRVRPYMSGGAGPSHDVLASAPAGSGQQRGACRAAALATGQGPAKASEHAIQRALVELLSHAARPGVAWTHMPAGEARHKGVAGKLKGMGTKPGWPDIIIVMAGRFYGLELKTAAGRVSPAQRQAHAELTAAGATIAVAYGLDEAVQQLKSWGVVR